MKEIEHILTWILDCQRADLYLKDRILDDRQLGLLNSILKKRLEREPLQYILGFIEFMGLRFKVNRDVFIPRPETELLVENAVDMLNQKGETQKHKILDIGTGSGNVAVSLAKFLSSHQNLWCGGVPESRIIAIDISDKALKVAQENAQLNNVQEQILFLRSDLFKELKESEFDMIVSNPPYIASEEISCLDREVKREPLIALDAGKDGLKFYRKIIKESPTYLKKHGILIMEMGYNQSERIIEIFENLAKFNVIKVAKDYNQIDRIIIAQLIN